MGKSQNDQADGLRRLLAHNGLRVVSVSVGGIGDTGAIVNLAGALAELGGSVLIADERSGGAGVADALGLNTRATPEFPWCGDQEFDEMIVRGPAGIRILPLVRCARVVSQLPECEQQRFLERFCHLDNRIDTLLVNAAPGRASSLLFPGAASQEVIVLAGDSAPEITAAYALIKRLCNEFARREFHVLVNNVASETKARTIVANMAGVARRYLRVSLDFMGHVPPDEKLLHAARLHLPVVAAFPGAIAANSFRKLAKAIAGWPCAEDDGCDFDDVMSRIIDSNNLRAVGA